LPYFTAGFPSVDVTEQFIRHAGDLNLAAVEIGFPYSDSIADGPVIQESFHHALAHGHTVKDTFQLVTRVRGRVECAIIAMVSYAIVHRIGLAAFMGRAADSGFDGVILPDVPSEESTGTVAEAARANLCHIGLVAPTTTPARRRAVAQVSTGFIYAVAVAGTTGERDSLPTDLAESVRSMRSGGLPVCVGFGISRPEHVRSVCSMADGAIVGSAIIRRITQGLRGTSHSRMVDDVSDFLSSLAAVSPAAPPSAE